MPLILHTAPPSPHPSNVMYPKGERNRDLSWHRCVNAHTSNFGRYCLDIAHWHKLLILVYMEQKLHLVVKKQWLKYCNKKEDINDLYL